MNQEPDKKDTSKQKRPPAPIHWKCPSCKTWNHGGRIACRNCDKPKAGVA